MVTVALDAMGGDYSPEEIIKGAFDALKKDKDINVILVGKKEVLEGKITEEYKDRCSAVYASEVITNEEAPVAAIRAKKDSSIVVGMNLVKEGKADGFVSAGSTGAVLVGGQLIVGRIKGILRPALAPLIPTEKGVSLLIDCGANVDARAEHLVQFARIGSLYMEKVIGIKCSSESTFELQQFKAVGGKDFLVFNGPDEQFVAGRAIGADAGIGGTYGVMPELFMKLNEYMNNQEIDKARELQNEVNEIIKGLLSVGSLYGACKYILHLRGVETGVPRLPMLPITDEAVKEKLQKLNKTIEDLIEKVK